VATTVPQGNINTDTLGQDQPVHIGTDSCDDQFEPIMRDKQAT